MVTLEQSTLKHFEGKKGRILSVHDFCQHRSVIFALFSRYFPATAPFLTIMGTGGGGRLKGDPPAVWGLFAPMARWAGGRAPMDRAAGLPWIGRQGSHGSGGSNEAARKRPPGEEEILVEQGLPVATFPATAPFFHL